jgi:uncharacterized protein (TIGR00369 family)
MELTEVMSEPEAGERSAGVLSGLEVIRSFMDRGPTAVGVSGLLGMRIVDVEEGMVRFALETRPDFGNPQGTLHGGITATLLDSAMACAVHSSLPPGAVSTTVDLSVSYLRAAPLDGRTLVAEGRVLHLGGRLATAEGRVTDDTGRLYATGTTSCMVFR